MELVTYINWLETIRDNNIEFQSALSSLLYSNEYQDQDGSVESVFLYSYENQLLSNDELRHFYILLHQRYRPYHYLKSRIVEIIQSLPPLPILDPWVNIGRENWYSSLDNTIEIHRGLNTFIVDFSDLGMCWTTSLEKAMEFCRGKGVVLSAKCNKEDVLCFFQGTDEHEVVIPSDKIWAVTAKPYTVE